jgi:hypothetical protein
VPTANHTSTWRSTICQAASRSQPIAAGRRGLRTGRQDGALETLAPRRRVNQQRLLQDGARRKAMADRHAGPLARRRIGRRMSRAGGSFGAAATASRCSAERRRHLAPGCRGTAVRESRAEAAANDPAYCRVCQDQADKQNGETSREHNASRIYRIDRLQQAVNAKDRRLDCMAGLRAGGPHIYND